MKKIVCASLLIIVLSLVSACSESHIYSTQEISDLLATLTNEDGTGEINLDMTCGEIADILDKYKIPYIYSEMSICIVNNSNYLSGNTLSNFYFAKTSKGLSQGDKYERVIDIYGKPDFLQKYEDGTSDLFYNMGKMFISKNNTNMQVVFQIYLMDDEVASMQVLIIEDYYAEYLFGDKNK